MKFCLSVHLSFYERMVIFLVYYSFLEPLDISEGKIDLLWASSAKMIELFHFVLPAGTM